MSSTLLSNKTECYLIISRPQEEQYNHIDQADMDKVAKQVKEKREWFDSKQNAQNQKKPHEDPVITVVQIQEKRKVSIWIAAINPDSQFARKVIRGDAEI